MMAARARVQSGVSSAGLQTAVQPAASAAEIFRAGIPMGKFQGQIMAATPSGSRTVRNCFPATEELISSPEEQGDSRDVVTLTTLTIKLTLGSLALL